MPSANQVMKFNADRDTSVLCQLFSLPLVFNFFNHCAPLRFFHHVTVLLRCIVDNIQDKNEEKLRIVAAATTTKKIK